MRRKDAIQIIVNYAEVRIDEYTTSTNSEEPMVLELRRALNTVGITNDELCDVEASFLNGHA